MKSFTGVHGGGVSVWLCVTCASCEALRRGNKAHFHDEIKSSDDMPRNKWQTENEKVLWLSSVLEKLSETYIWGDLYTAVYWGCIKKLYLDCDPGLSNCAHT